MWCDKNHSGLIRWGLHIRILLDEKKKQNTIMSFPFLAVFCSEEIQCCVVWLFQMSFVWVLSAGSRGVCCASVLLFTVADLCVKLWKPRVHMLWGACWLKSFSSIWDKILVHMRARRIGFFPFSFLLIRNRDRRRYSFIREERWSGMRWSALVHRWTWELESEAFISKV